jgi:Mn2+/Fe2+ NRAMP family transporter
MGSTPHSGPPPGFFRRLFGVVGPGVITGAADDDPSGVATYSIAGAQFGTGLLWLALVTWPLMAAVQMMCARIGMVTGNGLGGVLVKKFPRWMVGITALALLAANTLNVGADLAAMADAAHLLAGWNSRIFVLIFGLGIAWATIAFRYQQIASILKWLVLSLMAYVITAFIVHPNWRAVLHDTLVPSFGTGKGRWTTVVAILGTTISPYLFFWQCSQEVEESKALTRRMAVTRRGPTQSQMFNRKIDVAVGAFFSNAVMFFIILTCASTLHRAGKTDISSTTEAVEALRPLAGTAATLLYTVGLVGVGCLAIPTLTGSAAYALAETFRWPEGMDEKFAGARAFYGVVIVSTLCGIALNFFGINPVRALYWSAVVNGVLSPFLICGILTVAIDRVLMKGKRSSPLSFGLVGVAALAMFAAAIAMFVL